MTIKIIIIAFSYLLGSIPPGYLISKIIKGKDIRHLGSGNIGATNVGRTMGTKWGLITLLFDIAKGAVPVLLARYFIESNLFIAIAGIMAIVGHNFSLFLKFKGGKGVATALGVFLALAPMAVFPSLAVFAIMFIIFKFVSLGSISAAATFPIFSYFFGYSNEIIAGAIIGSLLIIIAHRTNIKRIIQGQENKFSFSRRNREKGI
jgi:glycerol-3-phosphate acyltransferase PlsY